MIERLQSDSVIKWWFLFLSLTLQCVLTVSVLAEEMEQQRPSTAYALAFQQNFCPLEAAAQGSSIASFPPSFSCMGFAYGLLGVSFRQELLLYNNVNFLSGVENHFWKWNHFKLTVEHVALLLGQEADDSCFTKYLLHQEHEACPPLLSIAVSGAFGGGMAIILPRLFSFSVKHPASILVLTSAGLLTLSSGELEGGEVYLPYVAATGMSAYFFPAQVKKVFGSLDSVHGVLHLPELVEFFDSAHLKNFPFAPEQEISYLQSGFGVGLVTPLLGYIVSQVPLSLSFAAVSGGLDFFMAAHSIQEVMGNKVYHLTQEWLGNSGLENSLYFVSRNYLSAEYASAFDFSAGLFLGVLSGWAFKSLLQAAIALAVNHPFVAAAVLAGYSVYETFNASPLLAHETVGAFLWNFSACYMKNLLLVILGERAFSYFYGNPLEFHLVLFVFSTVKSFIESVEEALTKEN